MSEELEALRRELEQERAAHRRVQAQLQAASSELEQFVYIASHDLQAPLRAIVGFAQVLGRRPPAGLDPETAEYLRYIDTASRRMQAYLRDLLEYSRAGRTPLVPVAHNARLAVDEAVALLAPLMTETQAEVVCGELPEVAADRRMLVQVFQHLIGNALKFRPHDTPPRVEILATREGEQWRFSVRDNGLGIPVDQLTRIFGAFTRLHPPERYAGTGMGLAVCKRLIERHGGTIWAESLPGRGSCIQFTLPAPGV